MEYRMAFFLVIVFFAGTLLHPVFPQEKQSPVLSFYWSLLKCGLDGKIDVFDYEHKIDDPEDNLFRIFLKPEANVYLYLYHYSNEQELTLLFPSPSEFFNRDYSLGESYFIPDEEWFGLAAGGKGETRVERFYLLASVIRLEKLESATEEYLLLLDDPSVPYKRIEMKKQEVLNQIIAAKTGNSGFKTLVEKPVLVTTRYRGREDELKSLAVQVQAEVFYTRTIRLEY